LCHFSHVGVIHSICPLASEIGLHDPFPFFQLVAERTFARPMLCCLDTRNWALEPYRGI
jgi:hypothetical protein